MPQLHSIHTGSSFNRPFTTLNALSSDVFRTSIIDIKKHIIKQRNKAVGNTCTNYP